MSDDSSLDELVAGWTLVTADWELIGNKTGATRLGFALVLKFFEREARFPSGPLEFGVDVVGFVARQVHVDVGELAGYGWGERSGRAHRSQIRESFGFRVCTRADEDALAEWLAVKVFPTDHRADHVLGTLSSRCRALRIEPHEQPSPKPPPNSNTSQDHQHLDASQHHPRSTRRRHPQRACRATASP